MCLAIRFSHGKMYSRGRERILQLRLQVGSPSLFYTTQLTNLIARICPGCVSIAQVVHQIRRIHVASTQMPKRDVLTLISQLPLPCLLYSPLLQVLRHLAHRVLAHRVVRIVRDLGFLEARLLELQLVLLLAWLSPLSLCYSAGGGGETVHRHLLSLSQPGPTEARQSLLILLLQMYMLRDMRFLLGAGLPECQLLKQPTLRQRVTNHLQRSLPAVAAGLSAIAHRLLISAWRIVLNRITSENIRPRVAHYTHPHVTEMPLYPVPQFWRLRTRLHL